MVEDEEDLHGLQTNFTNSSLTFQLKIRNMQRQSCGSVLV